MSSVRVKIFGIPETLASLERGMRATRDFSEPLGAIRDDVYRIIKVNFESQGRRGGGSWKAVDKNTARYKKNPQLLVESGRLKTSVTEEGGEGRAKVTKLRLDMGTSVPYAATHQYGRDKIPARPFVQFIESDKTRWAGMIHDHLLQAMRGV